MIAASYIQGAELPDLTFEWRDQNNALIAFATTAHTFQLKLGEPGQAAALTKTTGFTAADTAPNVSIQWATSGELNTLTPGSYQAELTATRTSDSKQRKLRFGLTIDAAIS